MTTVVVQVPVMRAMSVVLVVAIGLTCHRMLGGKPSFKGTNNEETLADVVLQSLRFPDSPFVSFQARDLIRGLLVKEPENRLGSEKGAAEIKQHPFFGGLNWALIRCAIPPEVPDFCEFEFSDMTSQSQAKGGKYLECKTSGEQVEFACFKRPLFGKRSLVYGALLHV